MQAVEKIVVIICCYAAVQAEIHYYIQNFINIKSIVVIISEILLYCGHERVNFKEIVYMARSPAKKPGQEIAWAPFHADQYHQTITNLVHFSFKTVNSNAPGGGVRLSNEDFLDLPYLSVRCLMATGHEIAMDYTANAGKTATVVKQVNAFLSGNQDQAGADEREAIRQALEEALQTRQEIGCDAVSTRLRQLLIPKDDGYVALTPVGSGGLCKLLNERLRAHTEAIKVENEPGQPRTLARIPTGVFGIGGANPQNVGSLVREMQRPMVFSAPTESRDIREVLSIHFRGIRLNLPDHLLREYRDWREAMKRRHGGVMPTNLSAREAEQEHVANIVRPLFDRADKARARLLNHVDVLPSRGHPLIAPEVESEIRGLIDPEQRDRDWADRLAMRLARQIGDYDFRDDRGGFGFDQGAINEIGRWIRELLR